MDQRKALLRQTGFLALGEFVGVCLMWGVFALLGRFEKAVLFGGLAGGVLAVLNFFLMAVNLNVAADRALDQNVKGGKMLVQTSYMFRLAALFLILFVLVKSGLCEVFSAVIPLLFVRPVLTIMEFFRKSGEGQS